MSGDPGGIGNRFMNLCIGLLLAAMALYGAVAIIKSIWVPLCIVVAVIAVPSGLAWYFIARNRRW